MPPSRLLLSVFLSCLSLAQVARGSDEPMPSSPDGCRDTVASRQRTAEAPPLRILVVESPELRGPVTAGSPGWAERRVADRTELESALRERRWDVLAIHFDGGNIDPLSGLFHASPYRPRVILVHSPAACPLLLRPGIGSAHLECVRSREGLPGALARARERVELENALDSQTRITALTSDVAHALAGSHALARMLQLCTDSMVKNLGAAFARIWVLEEGSDSLELRASSGIYTRLDGFHARIRLGQLKIGRIAAEKAPHLTNDVPNDPAVSDPAWARHEGMVAFAGYPLIVDGRVVGVMALFAKSELSSSVLEGMASVAEHIGIGIERKRAEQLGKDLADQLDILYAQAPIGLGQLDRSLSFSRANDTLARIVGVTSASLSGRRASDVLSASWATIAPAVERVFATGDSVSDLEVVTPDTDGGKRYWHVSLYPVRRNQNGIIGVGIVVKDVTNRRRQQIELIRQASLLDEAPEGILVRNEEGLILHWYAGAQKMYGYTAEEAVGQNVRDLLYPDDRGGYERAVRILQQQGHFAGELTQRHRDGREIVAYCRWKTLTNEEDGSHLVLAVNSDFSERRQMEKQAMQMQRMESIGRLASGIAHDLNNVLTPVTMGAQILIDMLNGINPMDQEMALMILRQMMESTDRGAGIIRQVLSFARGGKGEKTPLHVKHVLNDLRTLVSTFPRNIRIEFPEEGDLRALRYVEGNATELYQVLMNLMVNAKDAMPSGGRLTLTAENVTIREGQEPHVEVRAGDYILLKVADTGVGIPPNIVDLVFEPFFTTKDQDKGTGLGLFTALGLVRAHKGSITVKTVLGAGTEFGIYLPALPGASGSATAGQNRPALPKGRGETVLVVEDEGAVRALAKMMLESHGYNVMTAADGIEAVELYRQHRATIRLVLVDMMMPRMSGPETLRELRAIHPDVRAIAVSGNVEATGEELGVAAFIQKPYNLPVMLKAVRDALDRQRDYD